MNKNDALLSVFGAQNLDDDQSGEFITIWECSSLNDPIYPSFNRPNFPSKYYLSESEAKEYALICGGKVVDLSGYKQHHFNDRYTYYILQQIEVNDLSEVKKRALSKLTSDEKKALGL